jgi:hypothetical protein
MTLLDHIVFILSFLGAMTLFYLVVGLLFLIPYLLSKLIQRYWLKKE